MWKTVRVCGCVGVGWCGAPGLRAAEPAPLSPPPPNSPPPRPPPFPGPGVPVQVNVFEQSADVLFLEDYFAISTVPTYLNERPWRIYNP